MALPGIYRPSVAVNLIIRFDEALLSGGKTPAAVSVADLAAAGGGPSGSASTTPPSVQGAADRLSQVLAIVPKTASFELPGYRQAPKFSLTLPFHDFPFDPRALRAVGVEIYVAAIPDAAWAQGTFKVTINPANQRCTGTVDLISSDYDEKGSIVRLEGRGDQAVFIDGKLNALVLKQIDYTKPINEVISNLMGFLPVGAQTPIHMDQSEWPGGVFPSPGDPSIATRINQGVAGTNPTVPMKGDPNNVSFWDVVTNLCLLVGGVPYFENHIFKIRPARSIFDQKNNSSNTPFKGGSPRTIRLGEGRSQQVNFRKMVYGRNLKHLGFERKFGGAAIRPSVRCVSVDQDAKARGVGCLVEATWPDDQKGTNTTQVNNAKKTRVTPSGGATQKDVLNISVPGIKDKTRLLNIAEQIYEEIGRGEMGGKAATKDLSSLGGDSSDADLLTLKPGDAIEFAVDVGGLQSLPPVVSELNTQAAQSPQAAATQLAARTGWDKDLAAVLVGATRGAFTSLQNTFRVENVKYDWDVSSGITVEFDFKNYLEARGDVSSEAAPAGNTAAGSLQANATSAQAAGAPSNITSAGGV